MDGPEGHQAVVNLQHLRLVSQEGRQPGGVAGRADRALNEGDVVAHVDVDGRAEEQALGARDLRQAVGQLRRAEVGLPRVGGRRPATGSQAKGRLAVRTMPSGPFASGSDGGAKSGLDGSSGEFCSAAGD